MSVSSEASVLHTDDEVDSVEAPDELLGSQSRRWLADIFSRPVSDPNGNSTSMGRDGLFVDYHFPLAGMELQPAVKWMRPKELCSSPQFIVDGATRMDVHQGRLSDCWFLSALASLSLHRPLLEKVVPSGQSFQEGYDGSFYFQFWQYGQWKGVRIDDLLPTQDGGLMYLSSPDKHEFWSPLLEKAYAKLKGGYRALDMGYPHEAMADMTGGVTEVLRIALLPGNLSAFLKQLLRKGALLNCANCQGPIEERNELGIVFRHAYSLTGVEKVKTTQGSVDLVRLHNPWGNTEWEGSWSDLNGPEWNTVSAEEQMRLCRVNKEDGEFWMAVSDFRQNLEILEVCHLSETLSQPGSVARPQHCTMYHGTWVPRISAGGAPNQGWFWQNPQFYLTLLEEDDDPLHPEMACSFLVALMQKHQRRTGLHLALGLHIYQASSQNTPLSALNLSMLRPLLSTPSYTQRREVTLRGHLPPGHYVIVASTAEPNQEGAFILRVLMEKGNDAIPAETPGTEISTFTESPFPHLTALPSPNSTRRLFNKYCSKKELCRPLEFHRMLSEAIKGGVLAGSERFLALEHCKSMVVLMDSQGMARLDWEGFQNLWDKIKRWTDIFLRFDKNRTQRLEYKEVPPALSAAGIAVDDLVMQLIGLRYTEPDMTISYPGFLYLLMKLDSMIQKFHAYDMAGLGTVSVNFKQWLHMTMYN